MGEAGPPCLKVEFLLGLTYGLACGSFKTHFVLVPSRGALAKSGARVLLSTDLMNDCQSVPAWVLNLSFLVEAPTLWWPVLLVSKA